MTEILKQVCYVCQHEVEAEYIPEEPEIGVYEDLICLECGEPLEIPERKE